MSMKRFLALIPIICGLTALPARADDLPTLSVYTYSSFASDYGPGPAIKKAFEAECACHLDFVTAEDGVVLLSRLRLEGAGSKADVILGIDTNLTAEAAATGLFAPAGVDVSALKLPIAWDDKYFVPFDYGYFAVEYDKTKLPDPPRSLADRAAWSCRIRRRNSHSRRARNTCRPRRWAA